MSEQGDERDVWEIIKKQRIAMLTTEEHGELVSRPMGSLARPEDGAIYFVTRMDAKAAEIGSSAQVNLGYSDPHHNTYLSISGTARTTQDREKLRELWSMWVEAWLPQGPDAEDVALITVEPHSAKLWDSTSSNLLYAGKVLKAVATQTPPDGGRVAEVTMGGSRPAIGGGSGDEKSADFDAYQKRMDQDESLETSSASGPTS